MRESIVDRRVWFVTKYFSASLLLKLRNGVSTSAEGFSKSGDSALKQLLNHRRKRILNLREVLITTHEGADSCLPL